MIYILKPHHYKHFSKLGLKLPLGGFLSISDAEYAQHYIEWHHTLPQASKEELHARVLAHVQTIRQEQRAAHPPHHKNELRVIALLILLLLILLLATRGHAQVVEVQGTGKGSTTSNVATVTPVDANHNAMDVNIAAGGGTGGGPADAAANAAASESDTARQKVIAVIRLLDTGQGAGSQLVTAKGDQTSGMWVNCKSGCAGGSSTPADAFATPSTAGLSLVFTELWNGTNFDRWRGDTTSGAWVNCKSGCAGGSTTPADTFSNPTTAGLQFSFGAVWNGSTWDRLYGDKTNGAFVQVKAALPAGTNVIGHVIADTGSTTAVTALPAIPAGSNLIGKTGFDNTTPGTTNGVTQAQPARTTGTITTSSTSIPVATTGYGVATVTVNGTYAGVTINFEFSDDSGTTYYADTCSRTDTNVQESSEVLPSNQSRAWDCGVFAATNFRVRSSAFTSGTANIGITLSAAPIEPAPTVSVNGTVPISAAALPLPSGAAADSSLSTIDTDIKANVTLHAGTAVIGHVITDSGSTTVVSGNVAVTKADGSDVTLGAKADAKSTATDTTAVTMMQVLKEISAMAQAPASTPVTGTFFQATQPVSCANGATCPTNATLQAGSAIVGKVGIDQTTPGTTNAVQETNLPATVDTNSGNKSASTIRVVMATDQPNLTTPLNVNCASGCTPGGSFADNSTFTPGSTAMSNTGGVYNESLSPVTSGNGATARITGNRALHETPMSQSGIPLGTQSNPIYVASLTPIAPPLVKDQLVGAFGQPIGTVQSPLYVQPPPVSDPCAGGNKRNVPISVTANTQLLTAPPTGTAKICSIMLISTSAETFSIVGGTGSTCGTGVEAIVGSTTAANGPALAANGGYAQGVGMGTIAGSNVPGNNVCILISGSTLIAGNLVWAY